MSRYYAVAEGRNVGVYDNWSDCKEQVDGYSRADFRKFDSPAEAYDYIDQRSAPIRGNSSRALVPSGSNQMATRGGTETRTYQRTDYTEGRNNRMMHEQTVRSGRQGNGYYVEKYSRTYWEKK